MTSPPPPSVQDEWQGILDQDEHILWQGRPDPTLVFTFANIGALVFGLIFAGFALFWMIMAASAPGFFWMFGLIHFSVGIGMACGSVLWGPWRRRHTWYTLTTKRAFIATDIPLKGRRLKSYPITPQMPLDLRKGTFSTLNFAHEMKRTKNGSRKVPVGFERIPDGAEVLVLMRDVQKSLPKDG